MSNFMSIMQKRGQVSVFFIVGLVAIAAIIFVFFLFRGFQDKAREITNPKEYLRSQIDDIKRVVVKCIDDSSKNALSKISLQGGHFNPTRYTDYYGNKVSFLCYKIRDNEDCYNVMFTRSEIASEIAPILESDVKKCLNNGILPFRNKDYRLTTGNIEFNFDFTDEALLVSLNYPITLTKNNIIETQNIFRRETKTDFWKSARITSDIINIEARGEIYDVATESPKNLYFEIGRSQIEGGNLYTIVSRKNRNEVFYFAVEK